MINYSQGRKLCIGSVKNTALLFFLLLFRCFDWFFTFLVILILWLRLAWFLLDFILSYYITFEYQRIIIIFINILTKMNLISSEVFPRLLFFFSGSEIILQRNRLSIIIERNNLCLFPDSKYLFWFLIGKNFSSFIFFIELCLTKDEPIPFFLLVVHVKLRGFKHEAFNVINFPRKFLVFQIKDWVAWNIFDFILFWYFYSLVVLEAQCLVIHYETRVLNCRELMSNHW